MPLHRVIYRLDFTTSYRMINLPGDLAELLYENQKGLFTDVGETGNWRQCTARHTVPGSLYRECTVDPKSIVAIVESVQGLELAKLADDDSFGRITTLMENLCSRFEISRFVRAGFRATCLESSALGLNTVQKIITDLMPPPLLTPTQSHLGKITDCGLALDGESDAHVHYHLRVGPFLGRSEASKYMPKLADHFPERTDLDVVFDIDQFEKDFTYGAKTAKKWWSPLATNASMLVKSFLTGLNPRNDRNVRS